MRKRSGEEREESARLIRTVACLGRCFVLGSFCAPYSEVIGGALQRAAGECRLRFGIPAPESANETSPGAEALGKLVRNK